MRRRESVRGARRKTTDGNGAKRDALGSVISLDCRAHRPLSLSRSAPSFPPHPFLQRQRRPRSLSASNTARRQHACASSRPRRSGEVKNGPSKSRERREREGSEREKASSSSTAAKQSKKARKKDQNKNAPRRPLAALAVFPRALHAKSDAVALLEG